MVLNVFKSHDADFTEIQSVDICSENVIHFSNLCSFGLSMTA